MGNFSQTLQKLITISGVKHSELARKINFDSSYISKWLNTDIIPSPKYINAIVGSIVEHIFDNTNDTQTDKICTDLNLNIESNSTSETIKAAVEKKLLKDYTYDFDKKSHKTSQKTGTISESTNSYGYSIRGKNYNEILNMMLEYRKESDSINITLFGDFLNYPSTDIIFVMDINAMVSYLDFKAVTFNVFVTESSIKSSNSNESYITFLNSLMLVNKYDVHFYTIDADSCGLNLCIEGLVLYTASFLHNNSWTITNLITDKNLIHDFSKICKRDFIPVGNKLFETLDSTDVNNNSEMLHAFSGRETHILLGTVDNTMLNPGTLENIFRTCVTYETEIKTYCLKKHHFNIQRFQNGDEIKIIIFREALEKFVYKGLMRMIGKEIFIPAEMRFEILNDFMEMLEDYDNIKVKVIDHYLINEIKHKDLPNLYLSPTSGYFLMFPVDGIQKFSFIKNKSFQKKLTLTFDNIWNDGIVPLLNGRDIIDEYLNICNEIMFLDLM